MNDRAPRIDPTMYVYCRTHSEMKARDGGRVGPVAATLGEDELGRKGYSCWHCAKARYDAPRVPA